MVFQMDAELADAYYLEHFENTNETKYICSPTVPVRPELRRKMVETNPHGYASLAGCFVYKLGFINDLYEKNRNIFSVDLPAHSRINLLAFGLIAIIGVLGKYLLG